MYIVALLTYIRNSTIYRVINYCVKHVDIYFAMMLAVFD